MGDVYRGEPGGNGFDKSGVVLLFEWLEAQLGRPPTREERLRAMGETGIVSGAFCDVGEDEPPEWSRDDD